jgi:hypothetical protein
MATRARSMVATFFSATARDVRQSATVWGRAGIEARPCSANQAENMTKSVV